MRSSRLSRRRAAVLAGFAALLLGAAGCATGATSPPAAAPAISGAWVRPPTGMDRPAAGYLTIHNPGSSEDALVAAACSMASSVEIHETTMMSGMAGMHPIGRLPIPAGGTVELKPGGYHLMLMGVSGLEVGTTVQLELTFEKAGTIPVSAEVKGG